MQKKICAVMKKRHLRNELKKKKIEGEEIETTLLFV